MSGAARAMAWEFSRRHRLGLLALALYLAAFWVIKLLVLGPGHPITLDPPNGLAGFVIAPASLAYFYFVGVFSHGLSGDVGARESIYPARLFTLPVTTAALAGWPMLYGASAAATLWLAMALMAQWPIGIDIHLPWIWPALLMAAYLAWTQALMWMPYGLPGLRVIAAVLWLVAVDVIVIAAIYYRARESLMVALLAPQIPLAYLAAWVAVGRARRGDVADWRALFARPPAIPVVVGRARRRVPSPALAQLWLEWRRHGRSLPAMIAIVVPCELLLLFLPGNGTAPVVFTVLLAVLLTPPFMAVFAGVRQSDGVKPFMATRPSTTLAQIAAMLHMAVWSTLAAWLIVLVAVPLALALSGTWWVVSDQARQSLAIVGTVRASAIVLLALAGLLASTWKQLVQSLCIALTGRDWVIRSSVVIALSALVAIGPIADWIVGDTEVRAAFFDMLPWIPVALACVKMGAATWIVVRLYDSRLLSDRALITGAACWCAVVAALYALLVWFVSTPLVPRYILGAVAILEVPLVRLSAAPLALAWNRHR